MTATALADCKDALSAFRELRSRGFWPVAIYPNGTIINGRDRSKSPMGEGWGLTLWDETKFRDALRRYPNAGVGVCLGDGRGPGGTWLIDLEGDGPLADESLCELLDSDTFVSMGWGSVRGSHMVVGVDSERIQRIATGLKGCERKDAAGVGVYKLDCLPDLEIRIGGYKAKGTPKQTQSVVPPTLGTNGQPREWNGIEEIAPAPEAFYQYLERIVASKAKSTPIDSEWIVTATGGDDLTDRPGDAYAARTSWAEILTPAGWSLVTTDPNGEQHWRRPGKPDGGGTSATVNYEGSDLLYVFSTNAHPFKANTSYTKFGAYAELYHGGDHSAAARALGGGSNGKKHRDPDPEPKPEPKPPLTPIPVLDLIAQYPTMRPVIIDGILREREVGNVIASTKIGKSWIVLQLAFCVATGRPWFSRYVRRGRVLVLDNELHEETISDRSRRIKDALCIADDDVRGMLDIQPLRGDLRDLASMRGYFESIEGQYQLIIMDAGYRFSAEEENENDNAAITRRYNMLDRYTNITGAAIKYVHHSTKGSQAEKSITDIGAGGGAQSRAADTHLVLLADPDLGEGRLLVDAAVRSFAPIEPFVIRREFPLWHVDEAAIVPARNKDEKVRVEPLDFAERFAEAKARSKKDILTKARAGGMSARDAEGVLEAAIADGYLHPWAFKGKRYPKYATCPQPQIKIAEIDGNETA